MRILFFTTDGAGAFNGINAWLLDFLPALAAAGHSPSVLIFAWSPPERCFAYPRFLERGIPARVVFPVPYTEKAVEVCIREAIRVRADVFAANMVVPALLAMPRVRALGIPCVSVLHNDDEDYRARAWFRADATVVISGGLARLVPSDGRIVRRIPYGLAPSPRIARFPRPGQPFRLIYHGRIVSLQKRILETADALARICRAHPHIHADIYGSGPEEAALRERLARDDAGGRLRFLGPRPVSELRALLPDYHVVVLLSDFEGLGLSVLEGMAAGLVPVCLRTDSGLPDIVRHRENGLFVRDRETDFEAAVARLADSPDEWARLAREARATVEQEFSPASCALEWQTLLGQLAASPPDPTTAPLKDLPPPLPALASDDKRHPGLVRALWRWLRFGSSVSPRPW